LLLRFLPLGLDYTVVSVRPRANDWKKQEADKHTRSGIHPHKKVKELGLCAAQNGHPGWTSLCPCNLGEKYLVAG